jgi:spermidine/putrescine transport system permease protein
MPQNNRPKNNAMTRISRLCQYLFLLGLFGFIASPMVIIAVFSFDADRFPTIPWGGFSLQWHEAALADPMIRDAFLNSVVVAAASAGLSTGLGFCAAYIDYRYRFRLKAPLAMLVAVPPAVPATILGMAMLTFLSRAGLFGQLYSIVICHVAIATSFAMAIIRLRLAELGPEVESAAWNLGASPGRALFAVVVPFSRPAIIASTFLTAAISFDEYMIAWFVGGVHETLPVRILNLLQGQVNPKINAIGTVVLAISVALVVFAQRFTNLNAGAKRKETLLEKQQ